MATRKARIKRKCGTLHQKNPSVVQVNRTVQEKIVDNVHGQLQNIAEQNSKNLQKAEIPQVTNQNGIENQQLDMGQITGLSPLSDTNLGNVKQQIQMIPLEKIVTEKYQRGLNMKNVSGIVKKFDPAKLGVLVVNHRANGTYAVLDGQHRLAALRKMGYAATNCIVLEGMTLQQEADYFRHQNENKQSLRIADTFNAAVWAEDEESLTIKAAMDRYGFRCGKSGKPMRICAIGSLHKILRKFGLEALEMTLASIAVTWPHDTTILRTEMLAGLGVFWKRFAQVLTPAQFESRMQTKVPMELYQELRRRTQGEASPATAFNKTVRFTACAVLVDAYNKGLRNGSMNRLKLEWSESDEDA